MNSHCHVSLGGSCCLSFVELLVCTDSVTGAIGTKCYHWTWQQYQADLWMGISLL